MNITIKKIFPAVLGLILSVPATAAETYNFKTIDVPWLGSENTAVNANSTHAIAGQYDDATGTTHGFILSNGQYKTYDVPVAAIYTSINGISANGDISGTYVDASGTAHAFYQSKKGVFTTLDPLEPAIRTQGGFNNAQGQAVGAYRGDDPLNYRHGFIWYKGGYTTFNVPNDCDLTSSPLGTLAFGINDPGQIVGNYVDNNNGSAVACGTRHGFLRSKDGNTYTTLDAPGSAGFTIAEGINNAGKIAGVYQDSSGGFHGFIFANGIYTAPIDVKLPAGTMKNTQIFSINAQGEIGGGYDTPDGTSHGFVGTPAH